MTTPFHFREQAKLRVRKFLHDRGVDYRDVTITGTDLEIEIRPPSRDAETVRSLVETVAAAYIDVLQNTEWTLERCEAILNDPDVDTAVRVELDREFILETEQGNVPVEEVAEVIDRE